MIEIIYFEESISEHPRTLGIFERFPQATRVPCSNYQEVFNPHGQNFRLQKKKPSLILAQKEGNFALPIPESYGVGGKTNYYFSHMLNCLYDCRYCFLQGMYSSANYVLFVNYEDFLKDIVQKTSESPEPAWFFSGYDCDSLALDSISQFSSFFLPHFSKLSNSYLELRTKSVNIKPLLKSEAVPNIITAFSFTPQEISEQIEKGVPSVNSRIEAMKKLTSHGWQIGLRIDPIIDCSNFTDRYTNLFQNIFSNIPEEQIHSVSLGAFRMPSTFFKKIEKLYPEEKLFAGPFQKQGNSISYKKELERERKDTCINLLKKYTSVQKIFSCDIFESAIN